MNKVARRPALLLTMLIISILLVSCKDGVSDKKLTEGSLVSLERLFGQSCSIELNEPVLNVTIVNSQAITKQRRSESRLFSYEKFASAAALATYESINTNSVKQIAIEVIDSVFKNNFVYDVFVLENVQKKLSTARRFSQAIIKNDRKDAKQYFSDTIRSLPDEKINEYFFDHYFPVNFSDYEILGFKVFDNKYVGIFVNYKVVDGRRQTYIHLYELYGDNKIVLINVPG